jgi:histidinol-phosphatase
MKASGFWLIENMTDDTNQLKDLLDFAVDLAQGAGEITLRHFGGSFVAERKADDSFVTIADREAESYLRARIAEAFPNDSILGEEEGERRGSSNQRWILDPVDGTYSFVHGVPLYGVLIGVERAGEPILGVVNIPACGELVYAARQVGCFRNGAPARVSTTGSLDQSLLLSTDFGIGEQYGFETAIESLQRRVHARRTWGDAYGHVLVATGRAEIMLDPVMNVWDCAALLPIVEGAGGTFTDWNGERTIHGGNAISTNGLLFDEVMKIVRTT